MKKLGWLFMLVLGTSCSSLYPEKKMVSERKSASEASSETSGEVIRDAHRENCIGLSHPRPLSLVNAATKPSHPQPVQVQFELQNDILLATFEVTSSELNVKDPLLKGEYPYQYDVVEVFVSVSATQNNYPYYEFEVSPHNQTLQVLLTMSDKGKRGSVLGVDMGLESTATITPTGWRAELRIPLKKLPWTGKPEDIIGNAFSVIGKGKDRSYWGLTLPPQKKANFHRVEFFRQLLACAPASAEVPPTVN